jgi:hypothetical protein
LLLRVLIELILDNAQLYCELAHWHTLFLVTFFILDSCGQLAVYRLSDGIAYEVLKTLVGILVRLFNLERLEPQLMRVAYELYNTVSDLLSVRSVLVARYRENYI